MSARLNGHVFHDDNGQNVKKKNNNKILKRNDTPIPSFTQRYTQSQIAHGERRLFNKKKERHHNLRKSWRSTRDWWVVCVYVAVLSFFLTPSRSPFLSLSSRFPFFFTSPPMTAPFVAGNKQISSRQAQRREKGGRWRRRRQLLTTQRRTKGSRKQMSFVSIAATAQLRIYVEEKKSSPSFLSGTSSFTLL